MALQLTQLYLRSAHAYKKISFRYKISLCLFINANRFLRIQRVSSKKVQAYLIVVHAKRAYKPWQACDTAFTWSEVGPCLHARRQALNK